MVFKANRGFSIIKLIKQYNNMKKTKKQLLNKLFSNLLFRIISEAVEIQKLNELNNLINLSLM